MRLKNTQQNMKHFKYTRDSNKKVALKCLHNSQESIDTLINKVKKYPTKHKAFQVLDSNKKVALKCLHNLQESINFLINKAKKYPTQVIEEEEEEEEEDDDDDNDKLGAAKTIPDPFQFCTKLDICNWLVQEVSRINYIVQCPNDTTHL
ncbi:unnamed protein product [Rhizophagus irregularis]|nr:unnamed protein product [Rhizophagus irregularis]